MRRRWVIVGVLAVLALTSCATRRTVLPTPFPTEDIAEYLARLTPAPSASGSPSPSPSATAGLRAAGAGTNRGAAGAPAPRSAPRATPAARVQCPSGGVTAALDDMNADDTGEPSDDGEHNWNVTVSGTATNNTSAAVRSVQVRVTVHASNARNRSRIATVAQTIAPGGTAPWSTNFRYQSADQPSQGSADVADWSWANSSLASCPT